MSNTLSRLTAEFVTNDEGHPKEESNLIKSTDEVNTQLISLEYEIGNCLANSVDYSLVSIAT